MSLIELAERAIPQEEGDPGAVEWVVERLSERQGATLLRLTALPEHEWAYPSEVGSANTLNSLWDFKRGLRGIMAPLMLATPDYQPSERCNLWRSTGFGRKVAAALRARAQQEQTI